MPEPIILSPNKEQSFVQSYYDASNESHFWIQWRLKIFITTLQSVPISLNEKLHGIEVGCGNGILRDQITKISQWTIDGVELDPKALRANPDIRGKTYLYDITDKKEELKEKYDFLILFDVIEHIEDPVAFIKDCLFHVKENGYMFINVPALPKLFSAYDVANGHYRRYSRKELLAHLNACSLNVLNLVYWGFSMLPIAGLRKLVLGSGKGGNLDKETLHKKGFTPHPIINQCFKVLMFLETAVMKSPPCGTSLLCIAQK